MLIASILVIACGDAQDDPACSSSADFTSCADGVCIQGTCEPVPPCEGPCTDPPHPPLADTELATCMGPAESGADGTIECPGQAGADTCASTPFCGQDAQYATFEGSRFARTAGAEPVVTDAATGLVWQGCVLGQSGEGCTDGAATEGDWYQADLACQASTWGGHDDWRLPSAAEHHSIVDFSTTSPAFDLEVFPNTPSRFATDYDAWWEECSWTATDHATHADVAWAVLTNSGDVGEGSGTTYHLHDKAAEGWAGCTARCVREASTREQVRFLVLGQDTDEPVVADLATARTWQRCSVGQAAPDCTGEAEMLDWASALAHCEGLTYAGRDDWRLPDIKELRSIVDLGRSYPAVDPALFPGTPYYGPSTVQNVGQFWSSSARWYNSFALYVDMGSGFSHFYVMDEGRHVRCVR